MVEIVINKMPIFQPHFSFKNHRKHLSWLSFHDLVEQFGYSLHFIFILCSNTRMCACVRVRVCSCVRARAYVCLCVQSRPILWDVRLIGDQAVTG